MTQDGRVLTVIVCGAGPASEVGQLVKLAQEHGWTVQVVATPAALDFLDVPAIEALTGSPVRSQYRKPGEPRSRPADAIIVAPATYNTINKWAQGISDTYALGILAETTALGVPIVGTTRSTSGPTASATPTPSVSSPRPPPSASRSSSSRSSTQPSPPAPPSAAASRSCAVKASTSCSAPVASNPTNRTRAANSSPATHGTRPSLALNASAERLVVPAARR